ncbi:MAG: putative signal transduction histidine kinase [Bacteroidetes bacterium]|nr:putative signal transduction histidine kinase [Bacteroidota bacterium]
MYSKKLHITALISTPIMAIFELSPMYFLGQDQSPIGFGRGFLFLSLLTYTMWLVNIFVVNIWNPDKSRRNIEWYLLSFLFALLVFSASWVVIHLFPPMDKNSKPSAIFPLINTLTLNSIILIISNAIITRSKKDKAEEELGKLRIKNLEAEQQTLIQQMQPHFLFNALSTLSSIISVDGELAKKYVVKLSNFLRFTISAHEHAVIPLAEELAFTQNYIDLQQIRFEDSFYCAISIPEEATHQYNLPVYALQSLTENAIKHNAYNSLNPLKLKIVFKDECLIVSNNKMTRPESLSFDNSGVGLLNLNKRYLMITGHGIIVNDNQNEFVVTLKLIKKPDA